MQDRIYSIKSIIIMYNSNTRMITTFVELLTPDEIISAFVDEISNEGRSCSRNDIHQAVGNISLRRS